jgi:hypothetical protein
VIPVTSASMISHEIFFMKKKYELFKATQISVYVTESYEPDLDKF